MNIQLQLWQEKRFANFHCHTISKYKICAVQTSQDDRN